MAQWSITELSSVVSFDRVDGEYYLPDYLDNQFMLSKIETVDLPKFFIVSDGNHLTVSKYFCETGGVPYFRGQDVNDFFLKNASPARIPKRIYNSPMMRRSHFLSGDVLLSIVGTIGSLSLVPDTVGEATGSCKIAILRSRGACSPYFLAAFLMSKFGQLQIKRNTRGVVQMGLILKDFSRIRIPVFSITEQNEIETIAKKAIKENRRSKELYNQAQHLLESELGLDKLTFKKPVGYTARFSTVGLSEALHAGRIDAQCFSPSAVFYERCLHEHNQCDYLNHLVEAKIKGRQQEETEKGSVDYCSIKHISGHEVTGASKCLPTSDTPLATQNNLLLAITGATIGKIGVVKRYNQLAFSGDLLCLKISQKIDPHYLMVVLDHTVGQIQFNRWITGSTNGHLAPRDVGRVLVPRLDNTIETRIAELVEESLRKRLESEKLLDQAKSRVEQLIEEAAEKQGEKK